MESGGKVVAMVRLCAFLTDSGWLWKTVLFTRTFFIFFFYIMI